MKGFKRFLLILLMAAVPSVAYKSSPRNVQRKKKAAGKKKSHQMKGYVTSGPTSTPSLFPTPSPSTPGPVIATTAPSSMECTPTIGPCVSSFDQLQVALSLARSNDVVALCAGTKMETESEPVPVRADNFSLCCLDSSCILRATSDHRNLVIFGDSVTVQGISFRDGTPSQSIDDNWCGGNVYIDGTGNHMIKDCEFVSGSCRNFDFGYGGNLYIRSIGGSIHLDGSTFRDGRESFGGGASVDGPVVQVSDCVFQNNSGSALMAQLAFSERIPSLDLTLERSSFVSNTGSYGGGFLASGIGQMPKFSVFDCFFDGNVADSDGGAGAVFPDSNVLDITLVGNSGTDNIALYGDCDAFMFFLGEYQCFELD